MQRGLSVNVMSHTASWNTDTERTRVHLNTNVRECGDRAYCGVYEKTAYKASLQVPAPAVVHEADKTSTKEIPHQDGEVCDQHVGHSQPHKLLREEQGERRGA